MEILNLSFGIIGITSFVFSIYVFYKTETKKQIEIAKNAMIKEKLNAIENDLRSIFHNADLIIQTPKIRKNVTLDELQNLARTIRSQAKLTTIYLMEEKKNLDQYRFGKLVHSVELAQDENEEKI